MLLERVQHYGLRPIEKTTDSGTREKEIKIKECKKEKWEQKKQIRIYEEQLLKWNRLLISWSEMCHICTIQLFHSLKIQGPTSGKGLGVGQGSCLRRADPIPRLRVCPSS